MAYCYDCGAPCGKRNPTSWKNENFLCDSCARKRSNNAVQVFLGMCFLALSAVLAGIVVHGAARPRGRHRL